MTSERLPSFDAPPVIETVLGVQFAPLENWQIPHFGLYWEAIRKELPQVQVMPPLVPQFETFDPIFQNQQVRVEFSQIPDARCWYASGDERQLVQVQKGRFIYNWRKLETDLPYPRYDDSIRPAFQRQWQQFTEFLARENMGECTVLQCEVTYVNHIPKGEAWTTVEDWPSAFPLLGKMSDTGFLPKPESLKFNASYQMPEQKGRLRITANHAARRNDGAELIVLTLTARGKPDSSQLDDIMKWLDLGREWVVRGFTDFTSESLHQLWGRSV